MPTNLHKGIKYTKTEVIYYKWPKYIYQHFQFLGPPKYTQIEISGMKMYLLATLLYIYATEKSEAIACARSCRSSWLTRWWTRKDKSEKNGGPRRRRVTRGR
jgi:hypothetical protein